MDLSNLTHFLSPASGEVSCRFIFWGGEGGSKTLFAGDCQQENFPLRCVFIQIIIMDSFDEYDEFGNYIGVGEENFGFNEDGEIIIEDQDALSVHSQDDEFMDIDEANNQIVLSEDKEYYPDASEVYPGAKTVLVDEDTQGVEEPIVNPMKINNFSVLEKETPALTYSTPKISERSAALDVACRMMLSSVDFSVKNAEKS